MQANPKINPAKEILLHFEHNFHDIKKKYFYEMKLDAILCLHYHGLVLQFSIQHFAQVVKYSYDDFT